MLDGRTVIFLSCAHDFKEQVATPIRDRLNNLGYYAVIVEDEPRLRGTFDIETKVRTYIEASDAFVALCTPDARGPGATAENIIDEIARARSHPHLRDLVCVLKEASVNLPSNINPVWIPLNVIEPEAAFDAIRKQLEAWEVIPNESRTTVETMPGLEAGFLDDLFDGVGLGDHEKAEERLRTLYGRRSKSDQRQIARWIFDFLMTAPEDGNEVHVASSFLEATSRLDLTLVPTEWVERLVESPIVQHRMSAAIILWELAETMPGLVPIDLVVKLAKPSTEDWYVYAPALAAAKQLSLSRESALEILVDLSSSQSAGDRYASVDALRDLARVDAVLVPVEVVERLVNDKDSGVSEAARDLLATISGITENDRRHRYRRFGL